MTSTKPKAPAWTTAEIIAAIHRKHPTGQYAVFEEVRDGAGFSAGRSCDVMVMGLWPSRGLTLTGIEVKASRSDWLRELRNPEKAESMFGYCDYWYVAAGDREIVYDGELPPTWGLMAPRGGELVVQTGAPRLEPPQSMDRHLFACLCKRAQSQTASAIELKKARDEVRKEVEGARDYKTERLREDHDRLRKRVAGFQEASGIDLEVRHRYTDPTELGEAVKAVLSGKARRASDTLIGQRDSLRRVLETVEREIAVLGTVP